MKTCAVLPVKRFEGAKQRLDKTLTSGTRRVLAEAMVTDVLTALRRAKEIDAVVVVTGEASAQALARAYDAESIDDDDRGHSHAARSGIDWALERGYERVLLVPGDCPALNPAEVDALVAGGPAPPAVTVVPDRHGTGTNGLLLAPPDALHPRYGHGSFDRHLGLAREAGVPIEVAEAPTLALDVDTPDDLAALQQQLAARRGGAAHTRGMLHQLQRTSTR